MFLDSGTTTSLKSSTLVHGKPLMVSCPRDHLDALLDEAEDILWKRNLASRGVDTCERCSVDRGDKAGVVFVENIIFFSAPVLSTSFCTQRGTRDLSMTLSDIAIVTVYMIVQRVQGNPKQKCYPRHLITAGIRNLFVW